MRAWILLVILSGGETVNCNLQSWTISKLKLSDHLMFLIWHIFSLPAWQQSVESAPIYSSHSTMSPLDSSFYLHTLHLVSILCMAYGLWLLRTCVRAISVCGLLNLALSCVCIKLVKCEDKKFVNILCVYYAKIGRSFKCSFNHSEVDSD